MSVIFVGRKKVNYATEWSFRERMINEREFCVVQIKIKNKTTKEKSFVCKQMHSTTITHHIFGVYGAQTGHVQLERDVGGDAQVVGRGRSPVVSFQELVQKFEGVGVPVV